MEQKSIRIALAGNPNSGKTTLFNALTGSNQFVGNWPGVTVEKKEGKLKKHDNVVITDLPGIYSLSPYTPEEIVARNYLVYERPDAILNIVDGTNLERNLYLTTQLTELGIPVIIAINMIDVVRKRGDKIDIEKLARAIGCKIVEISALKSDGIVDAADLAIEAAKAGKTYPAHSFSGPVEHALAHIEEAAIHTMPAEQQRWCAIKIFERDEKVLQVLDLPETLRAHIEEDIVNTERELDDDAESIITNERYLYIARILDGCYKRKNAGGLSTSEKIDRVLTNRFAALPIFAAIMFFIYYISVSTVGTLVTDWTNDGLFGVGFYLFGTLGEMYGWWIPGVPVLVGQGLEAIGCAEWLSSLIIDGIVGGVGAVLGFVPQLLVLFLMLAFLEACGYMSRIAFVLDRVFRKFGLSGKSFIPILIGTGCGVPGIMASRTIENERDRRMTVITTTFIPCSAKLPIIAMITGALFGGADKGWWLAPLCYFIGIAAIIISGIILKKTKMFQGDPSPFVMELPEYHMPTPQNVLRAVWERGWSFIKKAGTVILLSTIIIWLGNTLGTNADGVFGFYLERAEGGVTLLEMIGSVICWIFAPLGFDQPTAAVATLMGLVAKEEIVAVFGVTDFSGLGQLAGLSFLIFNLLCAPCFAAMGAIKREMNSGKWTAFAIGYQCLLAYVVSLMVYQFGCFFTGAFEGGIQTLWLVLAVVCLVFSLYMLFRPAKRAEKANKTIK
jgi:ferrous iron transport protein B